ncbi:MAG: hypothetical protein U0572_07335 [Phycisphaerales bacterium]
MFGATSRRRPRRRHLRRAAILLETLLAIALFAGAAIFTLGALRNALAATQRSALLLRASDLARTAIAEIEAGVERSETRASERDVPDRDGLKVEVNTAPSAFDGLTLVEVTVRAPRDDGTEQTLLRLRQFVRASGNALARPSGVRR